MVFISELAAGAEIHLSVKPKKFVYLGVIKHLLLIRHVLRFPANQNFQDIGKHSHFGGGITNIFN